MKLIIVESPTKAKSLSRYLGKDYKVLASYGHIRDLPSKNHSVRPHEDFALTWSVVEKSEKALSAIKKELGNAQSLILATDPDREGEAIAWHVVEYLEGLGLLKDMVVQRVSFNAITSLAVLQAMDKPREINQPLVDAYLARLSLDYLVGFTLSPVLWRKLPGSRSAGRVQSVALRLVVDREKEIDGFSSQEYWTIEGMAVGNFPHSIPVRLVVFNNEKLEKFSVTTKEAAEAILHEVQKHTYCVAQQETKRVKKNPAPPFITSTLQQDASRKCGFSASQTMRVAQKLYEGVAVNQSTQGLITYMRTDSPQVAPEALEACRSYIQKTMGASYLPDKAKIYHAKAKNAQEAHEAIRPTSYDVTPESLRGILDDDLYRLYELIWKRAVASQMKSAEFDQTVLSIASGDGKIVFRATGLVLVFSGFLKVYEEATDDTPDTGKDNTKVLPALAVGCPLDLEDMQSIQHWTQPPPRYTEATLIKKMEELGIGRPSTYAHILQVLKKRAYVRVEKKALMPYARGRLVSAFLEHFFSQYIQYDFTACLESQLDDVSAGKIPWKMVLKDFWKDFDRTAQASHELTIPLVLETLENDLRPFLFPQDKPSSCPKCSGVLRLRLGKFGVFLGCDLYPECDFTNPLEGDLQEEGAALGGSSVFPKKLGIDPQLQADVSLCKGPYGIYVQWAQDTGDKKPLVLKRLPLSSQANVEKFDLDQALALKAFPKDIGKHPQDDETISLHRGRYGPYLKYKEEFFSLKSDEIDGLTLETALEIIKRPKKGRKSAPSVSKKGASGASKKTPKKSTSSKKPVSKKS